jgi:hypothetical protein
MHAESNRKAFRKKSIICSDVVGGTMSVIPPATMAAATRIIARGYNYVLLSTYRPLAGQNQGMRSIKNGLLLRQTAGVEN